MEYKHLLAVKKYAKNVKRITDGFSFSLAEKQCELRFEPKFDVSRGELYLSCSCDLVIDGVVLYGTTYRQTKENDLLVNDFIELYEAFYDRTQSERNSKRALVNAFMDTLSEDKQRKKKVS